MWQYKGIVHSKLMRLFVIKFFLLFLVKAMFFGNFFLHCVSTCSCQLSFSSTITPRNSFARYSLSIVCSPMDNFLGLSVIWFKSIPGSYNHILSFSRHLVLVCLISTICETFSRSVFEFSARFSTDEPPQQEIFVSSANIEVFCRCQKQFLVSRLYKLRRVMAQDLTLAALRK